MSKITRQIDELGRVVLPIEIRKALGWSLKTRVEITALENGTVQLAASVPRCSLCAAAGTALLAVEEGFICKDCLARANAGA